MQLGANEYLLKPVSTKALFDRLVSVLAKPRPMVRSGDYYGPKPRLGTTGSSQAEAQAIYAEVTGGVALVRDPRENRKARDEADAGENPGRPANSDDVILI